MGFSKVRFTSDKVHSFVDLDRLREFAWKKTSESVSQTLLRHQKKKPRETLDLDFNIRQR